MKEKHLIIEIYLLSFYVLSAIIGIGNLLLIICTVYPFRGGKIVDEYSILLDWQLFRSGSSDALSYLIF